MSLIDAGGKVRQGEELDLLAVEQWLKTQQIMVEGEAVVRQYAYGISYWSYHLKYNNIDLVLRRPPKQPNPKIEQNLLKEYQLLKNLRPLYPAVPEVLAFCQDHAVLGCHFYVMQHKEGIVLRAQVPAELGMQERHLHQLCLNFWDKLIELHQVPYQQVLPAFEQQAEHYCLQQVQAWSERFNRAKTFNVPSFKYIQRWLLKNAPTSSQLTLIHNDWRLDNVMLNCQNLTEIIGVFDWEMATLGDPLMDLGNALAYWVEETDNMIFKATRRQPSHVAGMLTRKEVLAYYLEQTGRQTDNWSFYEVFGLFRLAVLTQQIYARYFHRMNRNPAFKNYWIIIQALHVRILKRIAQHEYQSLKQK